MKELFVDTIANIIGKVVKLVGLLATFALVDWRLGLVLVIAVGCDYAISRARAYLDKKYELRQSYAQVFERSNSIKWQMRNDLHKLLSNHALPFIMQVLGAQQNFSLDIAREQSRGDIMLSTIRYVSEELSQLVMKIIVGYAVFAGTGSVGTMTMTVMVM